jgi:flagellum-specific peptidoglycan hydrolase FlgJ
MEVFPSAVIDAAVASNKKWRVPASVTLAQWALESNFGRAMPPGSNNPFGIKATVGQPFVLAITREVVNGKSVSQQAKFRVFPSLTVAFDLHARLLATAAPYARARMFSGDPNGFADALTGVYATDPFYGTKLKAIMKQYNLYKYDSLTWTAAPIA